MTFLLQRFRAQREGRSRYSIYPARLTRNNHIRPTDA
jgi:hypothetical protein